MKLAEPLLKELADGNLGQEPEGPCLDARVTVIADGAALSVRLEQAGRHVSRRVNSVGEAALWVESWLKPELSLRSAQRATLEQRGPTEASLSSAPPNGPPNSTAERASGGRSRLVGRIGMSGRALFDDASALWGGGELFGAIDLGGPWWVGAGVGRSWDPVLGRSALGPRVQRTTTHAVVRAGGAWPLAGSSELVIGVGMGVVSSVVTGPPLEGSGIARDDEGVGVLQLGPSVRLPLSSAVELGLGLELERSVNFQSPDAQEPGEPVKEVYPEWRSGVSVDLAFVFSAR